jgi:proline iminopeptidase
MPAFSKSQILHPHLHVVHFTRATCNESLVFIHGGPGFNSAVLEHLIEHEGLFDCLNYNIVLYDQRNCGRSQRLPSPVTHQDNIADLEQLLTELQANIKIKGLIGHSYGAKLLYDFYQSSQCQLPGIFLAIAASMLTPRMNNLMTDLNYLKKAAPAQYQAILPKFSQLNLTELWAITAELAPLFQANPDRPYYYWANTDCLHKTQALQKSLNAPANQEVLMSVRKDIYASEATCKVDIANLSVPTLWINGFHDYTMNGQHDVFNNPKVQIFSQSAHYPHLEENHRFCESINEFIK